MSMPKLVYKFKTAYDRLTGKAGAAEALIESKDAAGTVEALEALAEGFRELSCKANSTTTAAATAATSQPAGQTAANAPAAAGKLAEFERLQSAGEARAAGQFYLDNADAICRETSDRDYQRRQQIRRERGY